MLRSCRCSARIVGGVRVFLDEDFPFHLIGGFFLF